ncbi:MAG: Myxococcus phage Mx8 [Pseudomonadota bacterium]|jgi:hypothetical protein
MAETAQEFVIDLDEVRRAAEGRPAQPLAARFYVDAQEDEEASKRTGKRIFKDVEMIEIRIDSRDIRNRPVTQDDRLAYPRQYIAFKDGLDQEAAEGFPLKQWPPIRKGEAETLYMNGIRTVEQLALAPDARISILGPFAALKQKAKDWLEAQERGAGLNKLREEKNALEGRVAALEAMLKTQTAEIEAARQAGGVLTTPAPSAPDAAMAARMARLEALLEAQTAIPVTSGTVPSATGYEVAGAERLIANAEAPKRKGGRPKGSKNKPKVPETPTEG